MEGDRLLDEWHGPREVALLMRQDTQEMKGVRVPRVRGENGTVTLRGQVEMAGRVMFESGGQVLIHSRVRLVWPRRRLS